jgi:Mrp family chromosome partitioning ATPase
MSPELQRIRRLIAGIDVKDRDLDEEVDSDPPPFSRFDREARDRRRAQRARERSGSPGLRGERDGLVRSRLPPVVELDLKHLQAQRIVAYDGADPRARPFDSLRAQVLQTMGQNGWTIVGVTSPTGECGKSVIAANLAFSAARQPDLDVLLADFDLRRPRIAQYLKAPVHGDGSLGLLRDRADLENCMTLTRAGSRPLLVLPTASAYDPLQLLTFEAARDGLQTIRNGVPDGVVVLDLPPILTSDDIVAILPHVDCVVLVAAAGLSKAADVEQCATQLRETNLVRVVVNKTLEKTSYF